MYIIVFPDIYTSPCPFLSLNRPLTFRLFIIETINNKFILTFLVKFEIYCDFKT